MRAAIYSEPGPSSVLRVVERPVPEPGAGEVRVRVVRAGVNPTDWKFRQGAMGELAFAEIAPGQDASGVVDARGEGATGVAVGDRVWTYLTQHGRPYGSASEYVVVPVAQAVPLPEGASFDLGASLGVPAITAHRLLTSGPVSRLAPGALAGRTILVQGGAGAVGNAAIQLAVWAGATVIATISSDEKAALARAAGAAHTVDYTTGDAAGQIRAIAPDGVDLIVEVAPAVNAELDREVAALGGTIAVYANNGGDEMTLSVRATFSKNLRYQFVLLYTVDPDLLAAATEDITAAIADGALEVGEEHGVPLHRFPLEQTAAAHDAVEGGAIGKVLIEVAPE
ncbi:NADPH:quinone reductase [Microbacterium stercoris]|uniref:NADPH:quinone reductase n=1 Tax=Microbacterium stercoris TaxID=2820289 RepID=A0A939QM74_9MICO|nr:NADPH:quinone reductase [Microbacterium stercoris]MBO3663295.1 NADPH:quinone reductase [Microbacterium stercoris]